MSEREPVQSPLFDGIVGEDYHSLLQCFGAVRRPFAAEEMVYDLSGEGADAVGVVEKGTVSLIRIDAEGVATVLEEMHPGGVFGRELAFAGAMDDSLQIRSRTPCEVLFVDYAHIFRPCEKVCGKHNLLVQNMLGLLTQKAQTLSERVDVLSRRSIREKLLCYFHQMAKKSGGDSFELPFSLSTLADYVATDRSAMMRELRRMKDEGCVRADGRRITLLKFT